MGPLRNHAVLTCLGCVHFSSAMQINFRTRGVSFGAASVQFPPTKLKSRLKRVPRLIFCPCLSPKSSLHAERFSGTAGRTSSLTHTGTPFSTKDRDNDRCTCKCAQLASGGTVTPHPHIPTTTISCSSPPTVSICLSS